MFGVFVQSTLTFYKRGLVDKSEHSNGQYTSGLTMMAPNLIEKRNRSTKPERQVKHKAMLWLSGAKP